MERNCICHLYKNAKRGKKKKEVNSESFAGHKHAEIHPNASLCCHPGYCPSEIKACKEKKEQFVPY